MKTYRIVLTTGLALFAMFFGAGNIVFPLALGANAGTNIVYVILAFLVAGVGLPFLGIFATSLSQGDYWKFFSGLGKVPAFILITFLILIIGPFSALPRTETVTYHSLLSFLPNGLNNPYVFSALYCGLLFVLTFRHRKVIDIIGNYLSPIKLVTFTILIVAGLMSTQGLMNNPEPISASITKGWLNGYNTMDMLAAFFFCTVAYRSVLQKTKEMGLVDAHQISKIFLKACVVGALLLSFVYIAFMLVASGHALELQGVETAQMISAVSSLVLGKAGALFVGVCVLAACIATGTALTDVTTNFLYEHIFKRRINRHVCLFGTLVVTFGMSIMDFSGIMKVASPILMVLYPALIAYCAYVIFTQVKRLKTVTDLT